MSLVNALLVRWSGGWHTVEDAGSITAHGRCEGFLSLANAQSTAEVDRVAASILEVWSAPVVTTTMAIDPTGTGDVPFDDWDVSDFVTAQTEDGEDDVQVVSLSVVEDVNGRVSFVPELRHAHDIYEDRIERWLARMANGTLGGVSSSASPAGGGSSGGGSGSPAAAEARSKPESRSFGLTFHRPGVLADADSMESDPHPVPTPGSLPGLNASLSVVDSAGDVVVDFKVNGAVIDTITIPQGDSTAVLDLDPPVQFDGVADTATVEMTDPGTDAEGLVVTGLVS